MVGAVSVGEWLSIQERKLWWTSSAHKQHLDSIPRGGLCHPLSLPLGEQWKALAFLHESKALESFIWAAHVNIHLFTQDLTELGLFLLPAGTAMSRTQCLRLMEINGKVP